MYEMRTWQVVTRLGEHVIVHAYTAKEAKQKVEAILQAFEIDDYAWSVKRLQNINTELSRRADHERRGQEARLREGHGQRQEAEGIRLRAGGRAAGGLVRADGAQGTERAEQARQEPDQEGRTVQGHREPGEEADREEVE